MDDISICKKALINISVNGNTQDIQWLNEKGVKISNQLSFNQTIDSSTKFYVINKIPFGNELIKNGDFEFGDINFTSDYFSSCINGTMPQGAYCISENSGIYHPGWSKCNDHSGNGKMMISDGAIKANEKIWCQTLNVIPNTDYAFSAWITSLIATNPPIMQFSINGEFLGQAFQASKTPCNWEEFFEIWNSKLNTSAEICIINQNTAGDGNDFGIDDISLKETCFSIDSVSIFIADSVQLEIGDNFSICSGDNKTIANLKNNITSINYQWSTGENTESISITEPGKYSTKASNAYGCYKIDSLFVFDIGTPINTLPEDSTVCFNAHQRILLKSGKAEYSIWTYGEKIDTLEEYSISEPGIYDLVLSNGTNCAIRHQITINDKCSYNLFIPNAFTPNNDGKNESFGGVSFETYSYLLSIYNRWGNKIFESNHLNQHWDGTINQQNAPSDIYVYTLKYSIININTNRIEEILKQGTVTLIR